MRLGGYLHPRRICLSHYRTGAAVKIPYSPPHDDHKAGLRDYRAPIESASREWPPDDGAVSAWYRYALFVAILVIIALLVFILSGCGR